MLLSQCYYKLSDLRSFLEAKTVETVGGQKAQCIVVLKREWKRERKNNWETLSSFCRILKGRVKSIVNGLDFSRINLIV